MEEIKEKLYQKALEKIYQIKETFEDYFGEARVDFHTFITKEWFFGVLQDLNIPILINRFNCKNIGSREKIYEELYEKYPDDFIKYIHANIRNIDGKIIVYYPTLTVTNENNKSILLKDVFVILIVQYAGKLYETFKIIKSSYSFAEYINRYVHSHCCVLDPNALESPRNVCLGTGPLIHTTNTLRNRYDKDIWKLFCFELDKYMHTESISGVPYKYLERIISGNKEANTKNLNIYYSKTSMVNNIYIKNMFKDFLKYIIENRILKFKYINGFYSMGYSNNQYWILLSKKFDDWFNENHKKYSVTKTVLYKCGIIENYFTDGIYIRESKETNEYERACENTGKHVITFKNKEFTFYVEEPIKILDTKQLLSPEIMSGLTTKILTVLNYRKSNGYHNNSYEKFL